MTVPSTRSSVCDLTEEAMVALEAVVDRLSDSPMDDLSPLEFRTLMWAKCAVAGLIGIRADELLGEVPLALGELL